MSKQWSIRGFVILAIAAAALVSADCAAQADAVANILSKLKAAPGPVGVTPAQVLPAISNPRPYRQGVMTTCNFNSPKLGTNLCVMTFDQVTASHLLQIDKINCFVSSGTVILFNSNLKLDAAHLVGIVLATLGIGNGGPFYFKTGEKPKLVSSGLSSTDKAICTVFGTLWQTN